MAEPELPRVFVDFETRSRCDLKKCGGRIYAEHPSTEVLCAVLSLNGKIASWVPADGANGLWGGHDTRNRSLP